MIQICNQHIHQVWNITTTTEITQMYHSCFRVSLHGKGITNLQGDNNCNWSSSATDISFFTSFNNYMHSDGISSIFFTHISVDGSCFFKCSALDKLLHLIFYTCYHCHTPNPTPGSDTLWLHTF